MKKNDFSNFYLNLPSSKVEDVLLGFILLNNDFYRDTFESLHDGLFYKTENLELFKNIKYKIETLKESQNPATFDSILQENNPDFNVFVGLLKKKIYVSKLENPSFEEYDDYLKELEDFYKKREIIKKSVDLAEFLCTNKSKSQNKTENFISDSINQLVELNRVNDNKYPLLNVDDFKNIIEENQSNVNPIEPIPTKFKELDALGLVYGGQLNVIAGRPGMGKTSFALTLFDYFISNNVPSIYFSAEMSRNEIVLKLTNFLIEKNTEKIKDENGVLKLTDKDKENMNNRLNIMKENLCFVDKPYLSLSDIKKYVNERNFKGRILAKKNGEEDINKNDLKVIFVDYLQILQSSTNPMKQEAEKIAEITKSLKALALNKNVAIFLLSQLNREGPKKDDKRPRMDQLKGSGAIEQDADKILLLHREEYYMTKGTDLSKDKKNKIAHIAEIIVDKQRNGKTGTVFLNWQGEIQLFSSLKDKEVILDNLNVCIKTPEDQINDYLDVINGENNSSKPPEQNNNPPIFTWNPNKNK